MDIDKMYGDTTENLKKISLEYLEKLTNQSDFYVKLWSFFTLNTMTHIKEIEKVAMDRIPQYFENEKKLFVFLLEKLPDYCDKNIWLQALNSTKKGTEEIVLKKLKKKTYFELLNLPNYEENYFLFQRVILNLSNLNDEQIKDLEKTLPSYTKLMLEEFLDKSCQKAIPTIESQLSGLLPAEIKEVIKTNPSFIPDTLLKQLGTGLSQAYLNNNEYQEQLFHNQKEIILEAHKNQKEFIEKMQIELDYTDFKI